MKIAFISDIHGNLEALENVLRDIEKEGAEKIHFLGDVVGYGCEPNECIRLLAAHCDIKLLGNHDYAAMGLESVENFNQLAQVSMSWTLQKITRKAVSTLADFDMETDFLDYHLVHASPAEPDQWHYILTTAHATPQFEAFSQSICFVAHSHIPAIFVRDSEGAVSKITKDSMECAPDRRYIINIGSVGQPRDNDPRACYLLLETNSNKINYRRVEYDIKKAQEKMKKANMPDFLIERLAVGL
jgi:diadenosine tetraphosphatase ApaH/serine/threonine PP2A family protein phosphatase